MPQLVKGGKHTFGWSKVSKKGRIVIPPEALKEYGFKEASRLFVLLASRTSGGFGLAHPRSLKNSPVEVRLKQNPELVGFKVPEGEAVFIGPKSFCWVTVKQGRVVVPFSTLEKYGINPGDRLLVVRGSNLALGFVVRGPIVVEARKHQHLPVF